MAGKVSAKTKKFGKAPINKKPFGFGKGRDQGMKQVVKHYGSA